mgnify:CR=1 FL=1
MTLKSAKLLATALVLLILVIGITASQYSISFSYSASASVSANTPLQLLVSTSAYTQTPLSALASTSAYTQSPLSALATAQASDKPPQMGCIEGPLIVYYISNTTVDSSVSTVTYSTTTQIYAWFCKQYTTPPPPFNIDIVAPTRGYASFTATLELHIVGGAWRKYYEISIPKISFYHNGTVEGTILTYTVLLPTPDLYTVQAYGLDSAGQEASDSAQILVLEQPTTTETTVTTTTATTPTTTETTPTTITETVTTETVTTTTVSPTVIVTTEELPPVPSPECSDLILLILLLFVLLCYFVVHRVAYEKPYGVYIGIYLAVSTFLFMLVYAFARKYACSSLTAVLAVGATALTMVVGSYVIAKRRSSIEVEFEI